MKNQYKNPIEIIRSAVLGFVVGDALGVPAEICRPLLRQPWNMRSNFTKEKMSLHKCGHLLKV